MFSLLGESMVTKMKSDRLGSENTEIQAKDLGSLLSGLFNEGTQDVMDSSRKHHLQVLPTGQAEFVVTILT